MKIKHELINIDDNNRPGTNLLSVSKIIIHYVENPGTTARQNVAYIDGLDNSKTRYASAHYFVDDKEIIQIIPDSERAYHIGANRYTDIGLSISSYPNARTIGIEFCHPDKTGKPNYQTYKHLVELCKYLCSKYNLNPLTDILRHYDITGKLCPLYYVNNLIEFEDFKREVAS
jgi:N-acetylmuramoyl-L-alanine amidase